MKVAHLWALLVSLNLLLAVSFFTTFAALPASAQDSARSFVQDQYYRTPPSLSAFADNPRAYLRSEVAYAALRHRFAVVLGRGYLSEQDFRELLNSDQVRLRPCSDFGRFRTDGITPNNVVVPSPRDNCYTGEQFIEVLVNGLWIVAASQACFNPVTILRAPEPPVTQVCRMVPFSSIAGSGTLQHLDGTWHHPACGNPVHVPGYTISIPNTIQSGGSYRICE